MQQNNTLAQVKHEVAVMEETHWDRPAKVEEIRFESLERMQAGDEFHRLRPQAQRQAADRRKMFVCSACDQTPNRGDCLASLH